MDIAEPPSILAEMLRCAAAAHPTRDAVAMTERTLSYADLERETARMAAALIAAGAGKGTRIALMAPDGIFWLVAFLGALRIGALVAAVSTLCKPPELAYVLRNCDAQILIATRRLLGRDHAALLAEALPGLSDQVVRRLRLESAPFLRRIVLGDVEGVSWAESLDQLLASGEADGIGDGFLRALEGEVTPADSAVIIYTSGSTAAPKAVMHRQGALLAKSRALATYFHIAPEDRMMPTLPIFWVGGLTMALMVLATGATLIYPAAPDTETLLDTLQTFGATRVNSWGPRHRKLVQAAVARGIDVDAIAGLGSPRGRDGLVIEPALFPNLLGMSESLSAHSGEPMDVALPPAKAAASGRAIGGVERRVVDPDTGAVLGTDAVGELQIRGATVMEGFYKVLPDAVFTPDGFYPTGDLVRIDAEGYLFFVARRGDFIKTSGANVSRLEVEQALAGEPGVSLALVFGIPDEELGERLIAGVVPDGSVAISDEALRRALGARLSSYKVPRRIVLIAQDDIEWTTTGTKINLPRMKAKIAALATAAS